MSPKRTITQVAATVGLLALIVGCGSGETGGTGPEDAPDDDTAAPSEAGVTEIGVLPAEGTSGYDFLVSVGDQITERDPDKQYEYTFANTRVRPNIEQRWRAGNPPDTDYFVFNAQVPSTHEFTDELLELTPYLEEEIPDGGTWGDSFIEGASAVTTLDGETYGVVTDTHVIGIFYNAKMFDDLGLTPPSTWPELVDLSEDLIAEGIDPIAVTGMHEPYMGFWTDALFQREVGYDAALEAAFSGDHSDPGFLSAAEKIQELRDMGAFISGFEGTDFTAVQMEFFQGNAAMILMGTWLSSEMRDSIPEDFELGLVGFPEVPGATGDQSAELAHSNIMVVNRDSENIDSAIEYMRELTSAEVQTTRSLEYGAVSAVEDVPAPEDIQGLDDVMAEASELNVRHFGLEYVPDRWDAYYREVARLFFGEQNADEFIQSLDDAMSTTD